VALGSFTTIRQHSWRVCFNASSRAPTPESSDTIAFGPRNLPASLPFRWYGSRTQWMSWVRWVRTVHGSIGMEIACPYSESDEIRESHSANRTDETRRV